MEFPLNGSKKSRIVLSPALRDSILEGCFWSIKKNSTIDYETLEVGERKLGGEAGSLAKDTPSHLSFHHSTSHIYSPTSQVLLLQLNFSSRGFKFLLCLVGGIFCNFLSDWFRSCFGCFFGFLKSNIRIDLSDCLNDGDFVGAGIS